MAEHYVCPKCERRLPRSHFRRECRVCAAAGTSAERAAFLFEELHRARVYAGRLRLEIYDLKRLVRQLTEQVYGLPDLEEE